MSGGEMQRGGHRPRPLVARPGNPAGRRADRQPRLLAPGRKSPSCWPRLNEREQLTNILMVTHDDSIARQAHRIVRPARRPDRSRRGGRPDDFFSPEPGFWRFRRVSPTVCGSTKIELAGPIAQQTVHKGSPALSPRPNHGEKSLHQRHTRPAGRSQNQRLRPWPALRRWGL